MMQHRCDICDTPTDGCQSLELTGCRSSVSLVNFTWNGGTPIDVCTRCMEDILNKLRDMRVLAEGKDVKTDGAQDHK